MAMRVTLRGIDKVEANIRKAAYKYRKAAAMALNEIGEEVIGEAKELTPHDTGHLRRSGRVVEYAQPGNLAVTLGFGTEYAVYVHEIPPPMGGGFPASGGFGAMETRTARHQRPYGKGGEWKFLEKPVNKEAPLFVGHLVKIMQQIILTQRFGK